MATEPGRRERKGGSCGCLVLAVAFLLLGAGGLSLFAVRAWRDVRVFAVWRPTTCTVLGKAVGSRRSSQRSSSGSSSYVFRPEIRFRYEVDGIEHECTGWDSWALSGDYGGGSERFYERVLDRYEVGAAYPCWFDPDEPSQAVLVRRLRPLYFLALLPLTFLVLGGLGLKAALAPTPAPSPQAAPDEPPGASRLAVRIEPESTPGQQSCGALFVAVALLFVAAIAGYATWSGWQDGDVPVLPALFVLVFGGIGVVFLWISVLAGLASRAPATVLEADAPAVVAGGVLEVVLIQPGPLDLRSLTVTLMGEEVRPSKGRSPDVAAVHESRVAEVGPLAIRREVPFEHAFEVSPPADARPSGEHGSSQVRWRLRVVGKPRRRPRFVVDFPLVVRAGAEGMGVRRSGGGWDGDGGESHA